MVEIAQARGRIGENPEISEYYINNKKVSQKKIQNM